jgi:hypothetical protein
MSPTTEMVGWTDTPNVRGTVDLLWGCSLVIFTGVWTVLHLNIPSPNDNYWEILLRKIRWGILAVLAPDVLVYFSALQWHRAKASVSQMHDIGCTKWTLRHAFYANSGGFVLKSDGFQLIPLTAASLYYLVASNQIDCPTISEAEIWDKSKADTFAKGAALVQSMWLIVQCAARASQGLTVTPLELFSLSFVFSTAVTYYFWMHKPQEVGSPTVIMLMHGSVTMLLQEPAETVSNPYRQTPFDFVDNSFQQWKRRPILEHFGLGKGLISRIPNDWIMPGNMKLSTWALVGISAMIHPVFHLLGWNNHFPTRIEQQIWRATGVYLACGLPLSSLSIILLNACGLPGQLSLAGVWVRPNDRADNTWRSRIIDFTMMVISFFLVPARMYIIVESCLSLRSLPPDAYVTVNWAQFIPHV